MSASQLERCKRLTQEFRKREEIIRTAQQHLENQSNAPRDDNNLPVKPMAQAMADSAPRQALKDGGTRKTYSTGAQKEDNNATESKGAFHLLPPTAIRRVAEVWQKGAVKYTRSIPISTRQTIEQLVLLDTCQIPENHNAIQILHIMQKECVEIVTNENLEKEILSLLKDKETIVLNGQRKIEIVSELLIDHIIEILVIEKDKSFEQDQEDLQSLDLALNKLINWYNTSTEFALFVSRIPDQDGSTLITTIQRINSGGSYAHNVTKVSVCLATILKVLSAHSPTSKIRQQIELTNKGFIQHYDGNRNWEKGLPLSRLLDSGLRHAFQYLEGCKDEDHLAQATWNFLALLHTEEMIDRGVLPEELNDLPSYKPTNANPANWRKKNE